MVNQRLLQILSVVLLLCSLFTITIYSTNHVLGPILVHRQASDLYMHGNQLSDMSRCAFATVVTDPSTIDAILVSLYSLTTTASTKANVLVILPSNGTSMSSLYDAIMSQLKNVQLIQVPEATTRIDDPASLVMHLWTLNTFDKIIYFSPSVLFKKNVDHLFQFPVSSASKAEKTVDDHFLPDLFVLEPSTTLVHKFLKTPAGGASVADFLQQHFFTSWDHSLPLRLGEEVHIFEGPMKPWDFHQYRKADWQEFYDPRSFYAWRQTHDELMELSSWDKDWANRERRRSLCENSDPHVIQDVPDQFSVLLSTYNPERIEHLTLLLRHLLQSPKVHHIYITWHNPALPVPASLSLDNRVTVLEQAFDSLNNRFNPVPGIRTEAVYILDDDIFVDLKDLEFAFEVWQSRKDSVVGHFPRIHHYNQNTQEGDYKIANRGEYSMILTKSMFVRTQYLYAYTCLMDAGLHRTIDDMLNCEDIAFAMMVSGLTNASSTAVMPSQPLIDFGLKKGISVNSQHMSSRGQCVGRFISEYWKGQDPLPVSRYAVAPYRRPVIRRGDWDRIEDQLARYYG